MFSCRYDPKLSPISSALLPLSFLFDFGCDFAKRRCGNVETAGKLEATGADGSEGEGEKESSLVITGTLMDSLGLTEQGGHIGVLEERTEDV